MYSHMDRAGGVVPMFPSVMMWHQTGDLRMGSVMTRPEMFGMPSANYPGMVVCHAEMPADVCTDNGVSMPVDQGDIDVAQWEGNRTHRRRRRGGRRHAKSQTGGLEASPPLSSEEDVTNLEQSVPRQDQVPLSRHLDTPGKLVQAGSPLGIFDSQDYYNQIIATIEGGSIQSEDVEHILEHALQLALAGQSSCRAVQKLLGVLGGPARDKLVAQLWPGTLSLLESLHGNHVLTKAIESVPRQALGPFIRQLESLGCRVLARHRFGCRVFERLVEYGTEDEMAAMIDQCIEHTEELSRHQYGNFVIQSLLEHGSDARRHSLVERLLPIVPQLATHRTASHVVQQALKYSSEEDQTAIARVLLCSPEPHSFVEVVASRYGSYVAEELHATFGVEGPGKAAQRLVLGALPAYRDSPSFVRVATTFKLIKEGQAIG
jgi:hypothetical protein